MYIYWDYIKEKEVGGPSFEEYEKASVILWPIMSEQKSPFAIAKVDSACFEVFKQYSYIQKVPPQVQSMLISSTRYPPTLALTRRDIRNLNLSETITKNDFSDIVFNLLHKYMEEQPADRFMLSEFLSSNIISQAYFGEFIWIVGYTPKIKVVHYVGHDYFIYSDHVSCFKLTDQQIEQLPVQEMKEYTLIDNINKKQAEFDLTDETLDFDEISEIIRVVRLNNAKSYSKNELDGK